MVVVRRDVCFAQRVSTGVVLTKLLIMPLEGGGTL